MRAILALEDGRIFHGKSFGAATTSVGEICFNTSMTGYQEVLTDPSYRGQIVAMTYPLIGNYGTNSLDQESAQPHVRGFVIEELSTIPSNWRSEMTLDEYLKRWEISGVQGIDTRALTRHLRGETLKSPGRESGSGFFVLMRDLLVGASASMITSTSRSSSFAKSKIC